MAAPAPVPGLAPVPPAPPAPPAYAPMAAPPKKPWYSPWYKGLATVLFFPVWAPLWVVGKGLKFLAGEARTNRAINTLEKINKKYGRVASFLYRALFVLLGVTCLLATSPLYIGGTLINGIGSAVGVVNPSSGEVVANALHVAMDTVSYPTTLASSLGGFGPFALPALGLILLVTFILPNFFAQSKIDERRDSRVNRAALAKEVTDEVIDSHERKLGKIKDDVAAGTMTTANAAIEMAQMGKEAKEVRAAAHHVAPKGHKKHH